MSDLPTTVFLQLISQFFDETGRPVPFRLREKRNTQDDPFDEMLATEVLAGLHGITCVRANGPLITPDMVCYRPERVADIEPAGFAEDISDIVALEVKKLERTANGSVARGSGLDYNTTPPCGRVRIYDAAGAAVDVRGFYLFVCLEPASAGEGGVELTALCLVDGNALNQDFDLYLRITGQRTKRLGLGTYGDGADRARPMLIFANPLGVAAFDGAPTMIHPDANVAQTVPELQLVHRLRRSTRDDHVEDFYCYLRRSDVPTNWTLTDLVDPFPTPSRDQRTSPRGRFKLPFHV